MKDFMQYLGCGCLILCLGSAGGINCLIKAVATRIEKEPTSPTIQKIIEVDRMTPEERKKFKVWRTITIPVEEKE